MTELGSNKSVQLQRLTKILHEASLLAVRKHQSQVFSRRGPFQYRSVSGSGTRLLDNEARDPVPDP